MDATTADPKSQSRALVVFVAQLALTAVAVLVSRLDLGVRAGIVAVMTTAAVNGAVAVLFVMGLRREARMLALVVVGVLVLIAGLLVWPAWDVAYRPRLF